MSKTKDNTSRVVVIQTGSNGSGYWGRGTSFKEARNGITFPVSPRTPTMVYIVEGVTPETMPDIDSWGRFGHFEGQKVTRIAVQWQAVRMMEFLDNE